MLCNKRAIQLHSIWLGLHVMRVWESLRGFSPACMVSLQWSYWPHLDEWLVLLAPVLHLPFWFCDGLVIKPCCMEKPSEASLMCRYEALFLREYKIVLAVLFNKMLACGHICLPAAILTFYIQKRRIKTPIIDEGYISEVSWQKSRTDFC